MNKDPIRCDGCGRFISYDDLEIGNAKINYISDSSFSYEQFEYLCKNCNL
jgi:hypothetical protein